MILENEFLKRTIALAVATLLLAGCGANPQQPSNAPAASSAAEQQMEQAMSADKLIVGTTSGIESASRSDYYFDVLSGALSQMAPVRMDEKGVYHPLLTDFATTDAKTWTLTVRDGMKWHDGVAVTAADIRFTLEYLDRQDAGKYLGKYEAVNVLDDERVELVLKSANINALSDLTTLRIIPQHIYKDIATTADATEQQSTLGCGAYVFEGFDKVAGTISFRANRDFGNGQQKMDTVTFQLYSNPDTMLMALKKGDIDMIYNYAGGIDPTAALDLIAYSGRAITMTALKDTSNPAVLVFNNSTAPWNNLELRTAVYHALDYDKFRELFGSQYSTPATAGFVPQGSIGYIETPANTRNLEASKAALAKAGAVDSNGDSIVEYNGKPLTLELQLRNDKPVYQRYAELVQANLAEAGIAVTLKPVDVAQFRTITEQQYAHQAMISRFTAFGMAMGAGMGSSYLDARSAGNGQGQIDDPAYAAIVDKLRASATHEQFAQAAAECQQYYAAQLPAIALYWDSYIQSYAAELSGFVVDGTFGLLNMETWFSLTK